MILIRIMIILCLVYSSNIFAAIIQIGIIDSGITPIDNSLPFCGPGSLVTLTTDGTIKDNSGHGTNIAYLIKKQINPKFKGQWCLHIIKVFNPTKMDEQLAILNTSTAFLILQRKFVDVINYSAGGPTYYEMENQILKFLLSNEIPIFVAAGNNKQNLDTRCGYFPACYDPRIIMVGNLMNPLVRHWSSNYGSRVTIWENGTNQTAGGSTLTGTSQATAIATGKYINCLLTNKGQKNLCLPKK